MFQSLTTHLKTLAMLGAGAVSLFMAPGALADSISPTSFSANLGVGESATIRKTVTVSAGGPTTALVDIMFVFDTIMIQVVQKNMIDETWRTRFQAGDELREFSIAGTRTERQG
mgnify:CR=1 FL=1